MQHPIPTWSGIALFVATASDVVAKAAGLYADGPGFLDGLLSLGKRALGSMTAELVVMLVGLALIAWGPLGARIKRLRGTSSVPQVPPLSEALQNRLATLEERLEEHERRLAASTQRGDAQRDEVNGLRAQVAEYERVVTGRRELVRGQGDLLEQMHGRLKKLNAVTNELRKTATGRSFEIDIDKMIARLRKLMDPNAVQEQCGGDEGVYLTAVEEFANDLLECSKPWPRNGWLPYEGTLDRASNDTARELAEMGDEVRLTANEMESLRKRIFARHLLDGTAAFLEAHRKEAVARQRDFIDTPFRS